MNVIIKYHKPVLFNQVIGNIVGDQVEGWYLDGTLGDGGYSVEILRRGGKVVGVDVDIEALQRAEARFNEEGFAKGNYVLVQGNFRDLITLIDQQIPIQSGQTEINNIRFKGIILDLGVSSLQLEDPERGFSFIRNGPLDMRMDKSLQVTAADLLNILSRKELNELFSKLGEEKYSRGVADAIVSARSVNKITTTGELAEIVARVYRKYGVRPGKIHPATKVFQALRIIVNDELGVIEAVLPQTLDLLEKDGKLGIIAFHSLEDRIIKNTFKDWEEKDLGEIETKKPLEADEEEVGENPRSRSAKLRIFRKG